MRNQGDALMSIAEGSGENRATDVAARALDNPLLEDTSIKGATKMLIYVAGGEDLAMAEYEEVVRTITNDADENAEIKSGLYIDSSLEDKLRVTVIATGFETEAARQAQKTKNAEAAQGRNTDYISEEEFQKMRGGAVKKEFLPHRNPTYQAEDLDVPTVIRDQRLNSGSSYAKTKEA
jgi:cell division protein FtsZ